MRMMLAVIAVAMVAMSAAAAFAADTYTYQVGKSGVLKMWVVDFASTSSNSLADAVWEWEAKNPQQTLALCQREWLANAKKNTVTTLRYSCWVFDK